MSIQTTFVPPPTTILPTPISASTTPTIQLLNPASAALSLRQGDVLEIQVSKSPTGELGFMLGDRFIGAEFPPGTKPGDVFQVSVESSSGELYLQILSQRASINTPEPGPTPQVPGRSAIERFIDAYVKRESQADINQAKIGVETTRELKLPLPYSSTPNNTLNSLLEHRDLLRSLVRSPQLLNEKDLSNSKTVHAKLRELASGNLSETVKNIQETLRKDLQPASPQAAGRELVQFLRQQLESILQKQGSLQTTTPLNGKQKITPQLEQQLRAVLKHLITRENGLPTPARPEILGSLPGSGHPTERLFQLLLSLDKAISSEQLSTPAWFRESLFTLLEQLKEIAHQPKADLKIRTLLKQTIDLLQKRSEVPTTQGEKGSPKETLQSALRGLEGMLQGQEFLNQLNPMMQSLGEPAFILMPVILQGLLKRWSMTYQQASEDELDQRSRGGRHKPFEHIELALSLPALGAVQVKIAYRESEAMLSFIFEDEIASQFFQTKTARLEAALSQLGVANTRISVGTGVSEDITPKWYRKLNRSSVVA